MRPRSAEVVSRVTGFKTEGKESVQCWPQEPRLCIMAERMNLFKHFHMEEEFVYCINIKGLIESMGCYSCRQDAFYDLITDLLGNLRVENYDLSVQNSKIAFRRLGAT